MERSFGDFRHSPTSPTQGRDEVVMSYRAPTRPRTDLQPSAQACVTAAGETHVRVTGRNPGLLPNCALSPPSGGNCR
jgi:hypothetical protein